MTIIIAETTERKCGELLQVEQNRLLQMFATGASAKDCLLALTAAVSRIRPGVGACVLTTNFQQDAVAEVLTEHLPSAFGQGIQGLLINDTPIGKAILEGRPVTCADIAHDQLFSPAWRDPRLVDGVKACHCTPVLGPDGKATVSFALLFPQPHEPDEWELQIADFVAHLSSLILERNRAEAALRSSEAWLAGQEEAFQAAVTGAPLEVFLGVLARTAVAQAEADVRCAFYIADHTSAELQHVVGMSESYAECVDGFRIGPDSLACGLAVYTRQPVITADVTEDPRWKAWLWLAERYQFRACWSFPIETLSGKVVGTFAMYFKSPRCATPRDLESATVLARAAAIIICQSQEAEDRAHAETKLRQAEQALREADRRKDEFLAMLAHELRNPMALIGNAVRILRLTGGDSEIVKSTSEMLERQVGQMVRLVDDLLDVSRITRGQIELRKERIELAHVLNQAVEAARSLVEDAQHELTMTLPSEPIYLNADPTRLAQVVGNLLTNACKFMDQGGRISLTVQRQSGQAVIRVRDGGIGLASHEIPRIFDMFVQVDTALERSRNGLGIGLTLVKNLVEVHGGTVTVQSDGLGQGSEFVVRLPMLAETTSPPPEPAIRDYPASAARRILIVDDNEDGAESLAMLLKMTGHETETAHDGLEAVAAAERFRPEVVLLDIGLPKLNGYDASRRIRVQPWGKDMVLVAMTGWGQDEERVRSQEAGFDHHLVKPVDLDALTKLLASLLRSRSAR